MKVRIFGALFALLVLGACSSNSWSTRVTLGPEGSVAVSGPTGEATVENQGPGDVDVTAEDEDGDVRLNSNLKARKDCRFELRDDEKLKVYNSSDKEATIRVTVRGD